MVVRCVIYGHGEMAERGELGMYCPTPRVDLFHSLAEVPRESESFFGPGLETWKPSREGEGELGPDSSYNETIRHAQ